MQSEDEAVRAAESCVLADAERHMGGFDLAGGKCWQCDNFHEVQASDVLPAGVRRQLAFCGVCVVDGSATVVDRSEWHSTDECWEVH